MNHRSSVMKQFLQNAIQLQLFKQVQTQIFSSRILLPLVLRRLGSPWSWFSVVLVLCGLGSPASVWL